MKARVAAILAGLVLLFGMLQSANAAVVIAFSAPTDVYGWCAGYAEEYAESCAQRQCASSGGTDCQLVADCKGGWAAVALSADSKIVGIGAACNGTSAYGARIEALASCIVASHARCWTDSTLDPNAKVQSKDDNHHFDLIWYAQTLLAVSGYTPGVADGNFGPASTTALKAFQTTIGRPPDGVVSDEIVDRLWDAAGGAGNFVPAVKKGVVDPRTPQVASYTYGNATAPSKVTYMAEELAAATPDEQRLAVATILATHKNKCSIPAQSAVALAGSDDSAWNVTCAEGPYSLFLSTDGSIVTTPGLSSPAGANGAEAQANAAPAQSTQQPSAQAPPTQAAAAQQPSDEMPPLPAETPPASGPAAQTINSFVSGAGLALTCPATASDNTACVAYVQGVVDAFVTISAMEGKTTDFCLPAGETGPQLAQIVNDYLTSHPELQQVGGPGVVLQALNEKMPCKTQ